MFKNLIVALGVITLTLTTSHSTSATTLDNNTKNTYEFKYTEFVNHISNTKELLEESVKLIKEEKSIDSTTETTTSDNTLDYLDSFSMESTAYTGGSLTATGIAPVRAEDGLSTIAVDPSVIPLGSLVYIPDYGFAIAADTGGSINGNIVDLYLNSHDECINWGRRNISLYLIAYPGQW